MNSIRSKLFLQVSLVLFVVLSFLVISNNILLKSFYVQKQKDIIEDYYNFINLIDESEYQTHYIDFARFETLSNVDIWIKSPELENIYISRQYVFNVENPERAPLIISKIEEVNNDYRFIYAKDVNISRDFILLSGTLDNGNTIEIRIPIDSINRNIEITNQFLIYIGIGSFILALVLTFFMSRKFTKPILKLNEITKKMKELDFSHSISILSKDEIGDLANSINELASSLEETLESLKKEVLYNKNLSDKRKELLNNVSHELKTPLSLMQGYSEVLQMNLNLNPEKRKFYASVIEEESKKMSALVDTLLDNESINENTKNHIKSRIDLSRFIQDKLLLFEKQISEKEITIDFYEPESKYALGNITLIDSVFTNYLTNAIHYVTNEKLIKINIVSTNENYRIEIFNSFPKVEDEVLDKLWDSFYKTDESRNRATGGHGLGLSIVKSIQENLGLPFGVISTSQGITFYFEVSRY